MLACTADGGKLPPYVIFKRKTLPKEKFPDGVIVKVHEKGWMDEDLTHDWIKTVWGKRTRPSEPSLLVLDAFRCHKTEKTKKLLIKEEEDDTSDHPRRNDQHTATTRCEHQQAHEEQSTEKMERVDAEWGP